MVIWELMRKLQEIDDPFMEVFFDVLAFDHPVSLQADRTVRASECVGGYIDIDQTDCMVNLDEIDNELRIVVQF